LKARAKWVAGIILVLTLTLLSGTTSFSKQPPYRYPLGDIPLDDATYQKYLKKFPLDMAEALPTSYDARNLPGGSIVTPAKDQRSCGSCWAFASVGALESHILKAYGGSPEDLSEQQQVSCNTAMAGCSGGSSSAPRYWEAKGPQYEMDYSYTASDSACEEDLYAQLGYRVIDWHTVDQTTADFKTSLYTYGPSYWRFNVYSDFDIYWSSGNQDDVYVSEQGYTFRGGHAVLLIGWDDSRGAFLCKNSWGSGGPNGDGTFWIAYAGHYYSLGFGMSNFSLTTVGCEMDAECDDGLYCNGAETCSEGACQPGRPSCPDDGLFCNGTEVCYEDSDACGQTGDPCAAGTECDEVEDLCVLPNCPSGTCDEGEDCNNCPADCPSGSGGGSCSACFKGVCNGECHPRKEGPDCADCAPTFCCGDGHCDPGEDATSCPIDCGCTGESDCDDSNICTTDACVANACEYTWKLCSLDEADDCCGPDCTPDTDVDCAEPAVCEPCFKGICDGVCHPRKDGPGCPDCPS
jgi:hypothetical protein